MKREQILAENMGKPIILPESKEPVDVRTLDRKTYNEVRNSFRSGLRGRRNG
jgi:hypothetical protein